MRYAICTTPRTGAHHLGALLTVQGFGPCDEWSEERTPDPPRSDPFGWIIHLDHVGDVDLDQFDLLIFLTRRSVKNQAESWAGARASGRWFDGSTRGIAEDPSLVDEIKHKNAAWRDILKGRSNVARVTYEQMVADPHGVAADLAELMR